MPSASAAVIAGRPALVAGILMCAFGRSTVAHSCLACAIVASVSCARSGETSIDTRPSTPCGGVVDRAEDVGRVAHVVGGDLEDRVVGARAGGGELRDLRLVDVALRQGAGEDRRVRRDAADVAGRDQLGEVAGGDPLTRQVVEPDADALGGQLLGGGAHACLLLLLGRYAAAMVSRAASTTASAVMPNFWNRVL